MRSRDDGEQLYLRLVGYFDDTYQVMPHNSFTAFFERLLNHPGITVQLGVEALDHLRVSNDGVSICWNGEEISIPVIYIGALDELFGGICGYLPYRSLRFEWRHEKIASKQDMPVVAYPQVNGFTRITEYNKLPVQQSDDTTYAVEYPLPYCEGEKLEPYYPVLTEKSQRQYAQYQKMAERILNLFCCGRLADFKYYNMDQALARAFEICRMLSID